MAKLKLDAAGPSVQTSAQALVSINTKPKTKPAHHKPTPPRARDQFAGMAGRFVRDPLTGERMPADVVNAETKEVQP